MVIFHSYVELPEGKWMVNVNPRLKPYPDYQVGGTPNITISHTGNIGTPPFTNWEFIHPGFDYRRQNH